MSTAVLVLAACALGAGVTACKHADLRPALLLPMNEAPRDPDLTRNPVDQYDTRRAPETESVTASWCQPSPSTTRAAVAQRRAEEIVATLLGFLAGGTPLLEVFVLFDESAPFRPHDTPRPTRSEPARDPPAAADGPRPDATPGWLAADAPCRE